MNLSASLRALLILALALVVWVLVVLFAFSIQDGLASAAQAMQSAQTESTVQGDALAAHALVQASASERSQLTALTQPDVLSLANMITSAGTDAGVSLHVSDASPETPASLPGAATAIDFTIQASGSFSKLVDALALLETIPAPASIEDADVALVAAGAGVAGPWQLNAHIRILTTAAISP